MILLKFFMDLQKAFDTVCVERLLNCLENYGFRGTALNLCKSFLSDRRQVIKIGSTLSKSRSFTRGVIQGSIVGSWLFILFINSMADLKTNGKLLLTVFSLIIMQQMKMSMSVMIWK